METNGVPSSDSTKLAAGQAFAQGDEQIGGEGGLPYVGDTSLKGLWLQEHLQEMAPKHCKYDVFM